MTAIAAMKKDGARAESTAWFLILLTLVLSAYLVSGPVSAKSSPEPITAPANRTPAVWLGPVLLEPADVGIGTRIGDFRLKTVAGETHQFSDAKGERGTIIVVRDPECPVSRRYGPRISKMARQSTSSGFGFVFIYPNVELHHNQRNEDARTLGIPGIYVERGSFALAEALGVKSTGDVFVLDADQRLRYRGAVDDQYGLGYTRDAPTHNYLRNALDALREGAEIEVPATSAPGCFIDADPAKDGLMPPMQGNQMLSWGHWVSIYPEVAQIVYANLEQALLPTDITAAQKRTNLPDCQLPGKIKQPFTAAESWQTNSATQKLYCPRKTIPRSAGLLPAADSWLAVH